MVLVSKDEDGGKAKEEDEDNKDGVDGLCGTILIILPNLITYDVMKAVTIVTMPSIGNTEEPIAPTS